MHARHTFRLLAVFGALSMFLSALPVYAQYGYGYGYGYGHRNRVPRHLRQRYQAYVPVFYTNMDLRHIDDAYARGFLTDKDVNDLTLQYHSALANDQRFGSNAWSTQWLEAINGMVARRRY